MPFAVGMGEVVDRDPVAGLARRAAEELPGPLGLDRRACARGARRRTSAPRARVSWNRRSATNSRGVGRSPVASRCGSRARPPRAAASGRRGPARCRGRHAAGPRGTRGRRASRDLASERARERRRGRCSSRPGWPEAPRRRACVRRRRRRPGRSPRSRAACSGPWRSGSRACVHRLGHTGRSGRPGPWSGAGTRSARGAPRLRVGIRGDVRPGGRGELDAGRRVDDAPGRLDEPAARSCDPALGADRRVDRHGLPERRPSSAP